MMKRFILITIVLLLTLQAKAQGNWSDKISWSFKIEKINESSAFIIATAKLKDHWHVFSVNHDPNKADLTGYPTTFVFAKSSNYQLVGKLQDGLKPKTVVDDLGTSLYFDGKAIFKQKIEILKEGDFNVTFDYSFQVCDENGCIFPPDQTGTIKVSGYKPASLVMVDLKKEQLTINGDYAKDKEGKEFVRFKKEWIAVPEGNSPKFYKKYIELGGK